MKPYVFFDVAKGKEQRREGGGSLSNRVREGVVRGVVVGVEGSVPAVCQQGVASPESLLSSSTSHP
jgi:hypothetical protein